MSFLSRYQTSAALILFEKCVYNSCEDVFDIIFFSKFSLKQSLPQHKYCETLLSVVFMLYFKLYFLCAFCVNYLKYMLLNVSFWFWKLVQFGLNWIMHLYNYQFNSINFRLIWKSQRVGAPKARSTIYFSYCLIILQAKNLGEWQPVN